jgi:glycosyltransferase involved in cell wall biosynthesis
VQNKNFTIIIPALNEEEHIGACIESAKKLNPVEIIVVDGGSSDRTREVAEDAGALVVQSPKGRGIQMNRGASVAKGEMLLFLHADTIISNEISSLRCPELVGTTFREDSPRDSGSKEMLRRLSEGDQHDKAEILDKYIGGFFRLKFDDNSLSTKLVEMFANVRARLLSLPYGDQAIFIRRDVFEKLEGFREYPFLEDIDMAMRVRKFGRLKYLPFHVVASSRRIKKGYPFSPILISFRNVLIALLFLSGLSPFRLIKLYK